MIFILGGNGFVGSAYARLLAATGVPHTVITREYPVEFDGANEPYYPLGDARNLDLYGTYRSLAAAGGLLLCGRLASYRYFNMDQVIAQARALVKRELN